MVEPVGDVRSGHRAQRQEARRTEVRVDAPSETLHGLIDEDIERLDRGEEPVAQPTVAPVRRAQQPAGSDARRVVVVLRQAQVARRVTGRDGDVQQPARGVMQVCPQARPPQIVRVVDTLLPLKVTGEKEGGDFAPTRRAHTVLLAATGLERAVHLERVKDAQSIDHAWRRPCHGLGQRARGARVGDGGVVRRPGGDVVQRTALDERAPLRRSWAATLRADLDHAIRRVRAVQSGGGRSLNDFD